MKNTPLSLIAILGITVLFASCKKKESVDNTVNTSGSIMSGLKDTPQEFKVTAGVDQVILAGDSTILHFYPNSFRDASGNIITSGTINIQLIEMYRTGEMIANNAPTVMPDGSPLRSGGQIYIKATADAGKAVTANVYGIAFKQVKGFTQPMELYYGGKSTADSPVKWALSPANSGTRSERPVFDSTAPGWVRPYANPVQGIKWYNVFDSCTNFDFINCDHPFLSEAKDFILKVSYKNNKMFKDNMEPFLVLSDYNNVTKLNFGYSNGDQDILLYPAFAPPGASYKLYFLANVNGKYYMQEQSGKIQETISVDANPSEETLFNIKSRLGGAL